VDFGIPERMQPVLEQIRLFMKEEVFPLERLRTERHTFTAILPELRAAREKVKRMGLWAPQISREHGGSGFSLVEHALISEQLGHSLLGHYIFAGCRQHGNPAAVWFR